jgi:hypothetical protein
MHRKYFALAAAVLLAWALWLAWLWQPERQVRRHTLGLLQAIEHRDWSKVDALLADNYADRWGHDKAFVVTSLREIFGSFVVLSIEAQVLRNSASETSGVTVARVKMSGQGNVVAQYVVTKVNSLGEPFTFTWTKSGAQPWAWQLTAVDHPTFQPDTELQF